MKRMISIWMVLCGFVVISHEPVEAQVFRRAHRHGCCATCDMPQAQCTCTQTRPVVQTELRQQQVTTYRDVTETHVRNETIVQNVPITTCKNVTVDEGGYQMVWVPRPVTKQVAQTVIQQQTAVRAVPYQVTRRVPQISTQLVPVQTVHHVTENVPMMAMAMPAPIPVATASSCNTCGNSMTSMAPQYPLPTYGAAYMPPAQAYIPQPQAYLQPAPMAPNASASIPTMPAISVPLPQTALSPSPTPDSSTEQWQTIPTRPSSQIRDYDSPSSRTVPVPSDEARGMVPRSSRFIPAPSAATVWNSRQNSSSIR